MSTEHNPSCRTRNVAGGVARRRAHTGTRPNGASEIELHEFEELVRMVCMAPARAVDPRIVALLQSAARRTPEFSLRLALTALRLEQGLQKTQECIIRLQWELAQYRRASARAKLPRAEE